MWYRLNDLPFDSQWQSFCGHVPLQDPPPHLKSSKGQNHLTETETGCGDEKAETGNGCSSKKDGKAVSGNADPSYSGSIVNGQPKA
jgi:hypothetical protein